MVVITQAALSVAANDVSNDVFNGTDIETAPFDGILRIAARGSATGLRMTLTVGGAVIINDQPLTFFGAAGALSERDNIIAEVPVGANDRMQLRFRNTTGGALTVDAVERLE